MASNKRNKYRKNLSSSEKLIARFHRLIQFKDKLLPSQWMEKYHYLNATSSSEPGLYSFERTPYMREPVDCMAPDSGVREMYGLKGAQIGWSEGSFGVKGFWMEHIGIPILYTMPSDKVLKRASRAKIDPFIKNSPVLAPLFSDKNEKDKTNNATEKHYEGGVLYLASAQSSNDLSSVTCRLAVSDEISRFPASTSAEGSPIALIENRLNTFGARAKHMAFSTPTVVGECHASNEYEYTDKRRYFMPCPHCNEMITFEFEQLKWPKNEDGSHDVEGIYMECPACEGRIDEMKHKTEMMAGGKWIPTEKNPKKKHARGYQISSLYSPYGWLSWKDIAQRWLKACRTKEGRIAFTNTILGLAYEDSNKETPKVELIMQRRETYAIGVVPEAAKDFALVGGIDCQGDRLEMTLRAIGMREDGSIESYVIDHKIFYGDINAADVNQPHYFDSVSGEKRQSPWEQLYQYLKTPVKCADGSEKQIISACIDSGWKSHKVYMFSRRFPRGLLHVIKGQDMLATLQFIGVPKRVDIDLNGKQVKQGATLYIVSSNIGKDKTYEDLNIQKPSAAYLEEAGQYPDNYIHFPMFEKDYFIQLTAEEKRKAKDKKTGQLKDYYFKKHDRNEALDCFYYSTAAWQIKKMDIVLPENYKAVVEVFEKNAIESWAINT